MILVPRTKNITQRLDDVVYNEFEFVEYIGGLRAANRILPQTLLRHFGSGALDLSGVISTGQFLTLKAGWYAINGKSQMTGLGTCSITRNNSGALNGNTSEVLESVVPVTAQEFQINWTGYLTISEVIAFNCNTALSANNATQMWSVSYLGTKAPLTI